VLSAKVSLNARVAARLLLLLSLSLSLSLFPYFPLSPPLLRRRRLFLLPLSSGYHCHDEDDDCDANGCDGESFAIRTTYEYDIV
jgi:hypothetical protein